MGPKTTITINLPKPHAMQRAVRASSAKRKVICAGRRSGKTTAMAILAVEAMLRGRRVLEAAPVAAQTDSFWETCKRALAAPVLAGVVRKNETDRLLELAAGPEPRPRIRCKTAHDADSLRGDYADLLILDEYSLMDETAWTQVGAPMLVDNDGDAVFCFTPKSLNHAYDLYQRAEADTSGRWQTFHFTTFDNPHLSQSALAEITQDMLARDYEQEILARFVLGDGAVFRNVDACLRAEPTQPHEHRGHRIYGGADWGRQHDYTAISLICATCRREVLLDRWNKLDWDYQRDRVIAILDDWQVWQLRAERNSIGDPMIQALRKDRPRGCNIAGFDTTAKSKDRLIRNLALAFERVTIQWLPDAIGRHELVAYEAVINDSGRARYGAPGGQHDDTVIARALAWHDAAYDCARAPAEPAPLEFGTAVKVGKVVDGYGADDTRLKKKPEFSQERTDWLDDFLKDLDTFSSLGSKSA